MSTLSGSHRRWGWGLCYCRDPHPSFTRGSRIENRTMQGWPHRGRQNHPQRLVLWLHLWTGQPGCQRVCRGMPCHPLTDPELEEQLTCDPDTQIQAWFCHCSSYSRASAFLWLLLSHLETGGGMLACSLLPSLWCLTRIVALGGS